LVVRKCPMTLRGTLRVISQRGLGAKPKLNTTTGCWNWASMSRSAPTCWTTRSILRLGVSRIWATRATSSLSQPTTRMAPLRFLTQSLEPKDSFSERVSVRLPEPGPSAATRPAQTVNVAKAIPILMVTSAFMKGNAEEVPPG